MVQRRFIFFRYLLFILFRGCLCQNEGSFDTSLFQAIDSQNEKISWVISPISIRTVLEEMYLGAGGETKKQLSTTLGISSDSQIENEQNGLNGSSDQGVVWKTANWILVKNNFPLLTSYKNRVSSLFHSNVNNSDFNDPEAIANNINTWVSNNTDGLIKQFVSPDDIGPNTVMIVLNAVYFYSTWQYKFDKSLTMKRCFYQKPGVCTKTDMMMQKNSFIYGDYDQLDVQVVKLLYNDKRYSMVLVLPNKQDGLSDVVKKLPSSKLLDFIRNMNEVERVILTMPKFTTRFHTSLNVPLQKIGLTSIFQEQSANFSAMSNEKGVYISEIIHEAYISVTESGTKAAGASGGRFTGNVIPMFVEFNANHPFIYLLMFNNSQVLFEGQYMG